VLPARDNLPMTRRVSSFATSKDVRAIRFRFSPSIVSTQNRPLKNT
jgi:hypothetical protein